jgi:hypothetical protein
VNELQQQVQQAIDELVESGAERGLQVAVYRHGEQIIDAVAGIAELDDHPLVRQVHARPVRRVDRNRL